MKYYLKTSMVLLVFFVTIHFVSCTNDSGTENPISAGNEPVSLAKKSWVNSSWYTWTTHTMTACVSGSCQYPNDDFSFNYQGYSFEFSWDENSESVSISVDGTSYGTSASFTHDGKQMKRAGLTYSNYHLYNTCTEQQVSFTAPYRVKVAIENYVNPDPPTGLSVSPSSHGNSNQNVTVSWNQHSDTDVTGYKIYRYMWSQGGSYSLVKTINSRTTTSWVDSSVPWPSSGLEMARYKIRAHDGTHNLTSGWTGWKVSIFEN